MAVGVLTLPGITQSMPDGASVELGIEPFWGQASVVPDFIGPTSVVYDPAVFQAQVVTPDAIGPTAVVYNPAVSTTITVAPNFLGPTARVLNPTFTPW